jgi:chorismate dehydratase
LLFGKIEYLNLLPFHLFMKRYSRSSQHYMSFRYKKGVPSKINAAYAARRVDAAFISSIKAQKESYVKLGIIAKREVLSVLLLPSTADIKDSASASSNVLAQILGLHGEVLIGDNALKHYLTGDTDAIDLAEAWHERYKLPFVFALLCYHGHDRQVKRLADTFSRSHYKIPQYQLQKAARRTGIPAKEISRYLTYISYTLDHKAEAGLRKFWHLSKNT